MASFFIFGMSSGVSRVDFAGTIQVRAAVSKEGLRRAQLAQFGQARARDRMGSRLAAHAAGQWSGLSQSSHEPTQAQDHSSQGGSSQGGNLQGPASTVWAGTGPGPNGVPPRSSRCRAVVRAQLVQSWTPHTGTTA